MLAAPPGDITANVVAHDLRDVEVRRMAPLAPSPAPRRVMPPPVAPPSASASPNAADPVAVARLREAWAAADGPSRVAFITAVLGACDAP